MKSFLLLFLLCCSGLFGADDDILGQGEFRYRVVKDWAKEALAKVSVKNGHAVAFDRAGRLFFLTDDARNNIVILSKQGRLLDTWSARMPGAHGLTIIEENGREALFITDTALHEVRKLTLKGEELLHLPWPEKTGLYASDKEYKPSKVLHASAGDFYVFDGYGKDYVHHYKADGTLMKSWGGTIGEGEAQLAHFGPHGGVIDTRDPKNPIILVMMSDRQEVKRFHLDGTYIDKFPMPGANPRDGVLFGDFLIIPHLSDNWPADKNAPGFISILDRNNRIISNVGGSPPVYENGVLQSMKTTTKAFIHPHGVAIDEEGNLYVAQFSSPAAPLIKLQRVR